MRTLLGSFVALAAVLVGCSTGVPAVEQSAIEDSLLPSGTQLPYDLEVPDGAALVGTVFPDPWVVDPPPSTSTDGFGAVLLLTDDAETVLDRISEQASTVGYSSQRDRTPFPSVTLERDKLSIQAQANGSARVGGEEATIVSLAATPGLVETDGPPGSSKPAEMPVDVLPFSDNAPGTEDVRAISTESFDQPLELEVVEGSRLLLPFESQGLATVLNAIFVVTGDVDRVLDGYRDQMRDHWIEGGFSAENENKPVSSRVRDFRIVSDYSYCRGGCGSYSAKAVIRTSGRGLLSVSATNRS